MASGSSSGVLFNIKKSAKSIGISMHIAVLCVGNITFCKKNCRAFAGKSKFDFWNNINKLKKSSKPHETPVIQIRAINDTHYNYTAKQQVRPRRALLEVSNQTFLYDNSGLP